MIETAVYVVLGTLAAAYLLAIVAGLVAVWPWGAIGLVGLGAVGVLFVKVLHDRLNNAEDDHYSRNVDK